MSLVIISTSMVPTSSDNVTPARSRSTVSALSIKKLRHTDIHTYGPSALKGVCSAIANTNNIVLNDDVYLTWAENITILFDYSSRRI